MSQDQSKDTRNATRIATDFQQFIRTESLQSASKLDFDVLIIGSGYGGSIAAARLASARLQSLDATRYKSGARIGILERGKEYLPGEFPNDLGILPGSVRIDRWDTDNPLGNADGLFRLIVGPDVTALVGSALGGTSQINANVAIAPNQEDLDRWPLEGKAKSDYTLGALATYLDKAREGLGVNDYPSSGPFDTKKSQAHQKLSDAINQSTDFKASCSQAPLTVAFSETTHVMKLPDGGELKINRDPCIACGECFTGCNYNAKNSLTTNYLPVAHHLGVEIITRTYVSRFRFREQRLQKGSSGEHGRHPDSTVANEYPWEVLTYPVDAENAPQKYSSITLRCRILVISAGSIGSNEILIRSQEASRNENNPELTKLRFSRLLGQHFSCNGDSISAAYDFKFDVNGIGGESTKTKPGGTAGERGIGPTITSSIRLTPRHPQGSSGREYGTIPVLIQDGAVPGALSDFFSEMLTTAALPIEMSRGWSQRQRRQAKADPLAVDPESIRRSHTILTIGHDSARGEIKLARDEEYSESSDPIERKDFRHAKIHWPKVGQQNVYQAGDDLLHRAVQHGSLDGLHVSNPLLKPIPRDFSRVLGGPPAGNAALTVHPIGGCSLGGNAVQGVVHFYDFAVFREPRTEDPSTNAQICDVYPGLYVCDGSVLPHSVGVNPLLTIAALSERFAERLITKLEKYWKTLAPPPAGKYDFHIPILNSYRRDHSAIAVELQEQMISPLLESAIKIDPDNPANNSFANKRLIHAFGTPDPTMNWSDVEAPMPNGSVRSLGASGDITSKKNIYRAPRLRFAVKAQITDLDQFLRNEKRELTPEEAYLILERDHSSFQPDQRLMEIGRLVLDKRKERKSTISLLTRYRTAPFCHFLRKISYCGTWIASRLWETWSDRLLEEGSSRKRERTWRDREIIAWPGGVHERLLTWIRRLSDVADYAVMMWKVANLSAEERKFSYRICLTNPGGDRNYTLVGCKRLRYARHVNPWTALGTLPNATLKEVKSPRRKFWMGEKTIWSGKLEIDLRYMLEAGAPQIIDQPDSPHGIRAMAAFGLLFARSIFQTSIWQFKLPVYAPHPEPEVEGYGKDEWPMPGPLRHGVRGPYLSTEVVYCEFEDRHYEPRDKRIRQRTSTIQFSRYLPPEGTERLHSEPLVCFHGVLHSSLPYALTTIDMNMTEYLCTKGHEVWLIDTRLSVANPDRNEDWSLDEIAEQDVPRAIEHVLQATGKAQVNVFAHCVGAATFAMALLQRDNNRLIGKDGTSKISKLVFCQFGPYMVPSKGNRIRLELAAFARDALELKVYDPAPHAGSVSVTDSLIDRIASTYPEEPSPDRTSHRRWVEKFRDLFYAIASHRREKLRIWPPPWPPIAKYRIDEPLCNRLTLMLGRNWRHVNLNEQTHRALRSFIGPTRMKAFFQTVYFGQRGRIVNRFGEALYTQDANFQKIKFPVYCIHGEQNDLFDPRTTRATWLKLRYLQASSPDNNFRAKPSFFHDTFVGYGHLECMFGKNAHQDVFPRVEAFFRSGNPEPTAAHSIPSSTSTSDLPDVSGSDKSSPSDVRLVKIKPPISGPILGWTRRTSISRSDQINGAARIWASADDERTYQPVMMFVAILNRRISSAAGVVQDPGSIKAIAVYTERLNLGDEAGNSLPGASKGSPTGQAATKPQIGSAASVIDKKALTVFKSMDVRFDNFGTNEDAHLLVGFISTFGTPLEFSLHSRNSIPDSQSDLARIELKNFNFLLKTALKGNPEDAWQHCQIQLKASYFGRHDGRSKQLPGASFIVGSCRYPGNPFEQKLVDTAVVPYIAPALDPHDTLDTVGSRSLSPLQSTSLSQGLSSNASKFSAEFCLLLGDQIYADANNEAFDSSLARDGITKRYQKAFERINPSARPKPGEPRTFAALLRSLPIYMAPDDHEISDNWSAPVRTRAFRRNNKVDRIGWFEQEERNYGWGIDALETFQWSHSPQTFAAAPAYPFENVESPKSPRPSATNRANSLWYEFFHSGMPFFVMDTRTRRTADSILGAGNTGTLIEGQNKNLSKQWHDLANWLDKVQCWRAELGANVPAFICCGSVPFPPNLYRGTFSPNTSNDDGWSQHPSDQARLIQLIQDKKVNNLVFLSGDRHLSLGADIRIPLPGPSKTYLRAVSIVCSAIYSPLPFANSQPWDFADACDGWQKCGLPLADDIEYSIRYKESRNAFTEVSIRFDWENNVASIELKVAQTVARFLLPVQTQQK